MKTTIEQRKFKAKLPKKHPKDPDDWEFVRINYQLFINDKGELVDVKNEFGYSVEKSSECWEFFNEKYK